jgi:hypothetical protein
MTMVDRGCAHLRSMPHGSPDDISALNLTIPSEEFRDTEPKFRVVVRQLLQYAYHAAP